MQLCQCDLVLGLLVLWPLTKIRPLRGQGLTQGEVSPPVLMDLIHSDK